MPRPSPFWRGILQVPSYALPLWLSLFLSLFYYYHYYYYYQYYHHHHYYWTIHLGGAVQECMISIANAHEILQYCTKPSIYSVSWTICIGKIRVTFTYPKLYLSISIIVSPFHFLLAYSADIFVCTPSETQYKLSKFICTGYEQRVRLKLGFIDVPIAKTGIEPSHCDIESTGLWNDRMAM